jgi:hypothetical protein
VNGPKRKRLEANGWRVGSGEEFLRSTTGGVAQRTLAADVTVADTSSNRQTKGRDRGAARARHRAPVGCDPWLSAFTDAIVKRGRDIAVATITKRFASSGIRLNRREQLAFVEFFAGEGPSPTIRRRRRAGSAPIVALSPEDIREQFRATKAGTPRRNLGERAGTQDPDRLVPPEKLEEDREDSVERGGVQPS